MADSTGFPVPSETTGATSDRTEWNQDAFTTRATTMSHSDSVAYPANNSYSDDGNMEPFDAMPPFTVPGESQDISMFTGATGPQGRQASDSRG